MANGTPQYKHDCNKCKFLGSFEHEYVEYDFYICIDKKYLGLSSLIARYSDEGQCYRSNDLWDVRLMYNKHELVPDSIWKHAYEFVLAEMPELDDDSMYKW